MDRQKPSNLEKGSIQEMDSNHKEKYEKPQIKRHAVVMTMAPAGCKMGHGLFPFCTKREDITDKYSTNKYAYRRGEKLP